MEGFPPGRYRHAAAMTVSLAIIGAGAHARDQHLPAIAAWQAEHPGAVRVAVVCDRRAEAAAALAARCGAAAIDDWRAAIATPGLGAVLVCTPPALTPEVALAAAGRGLALWLEKPIAADLEGAERLAAVLAGHRHQVSMNRRFEPVFAAAARHLSTRTVRRLEMRFARAGRREPDFLTSTGIHALDLLQHLAGGLRLLGVERTAADGARRFRLRLAGARCPEIVLDVDPVSANAERVVAVGDGWRLEATSAWFDAGRLDLHGDGWDGPGLALDPALPEWERNGNRAEAAHVLAALVDGTPLSPQLADVIGPTRIAHAAAGG